MKTTASQRRIYIDSLRVLGTVAVFLFHCIQPFNPNDHWHIQNADKSQTLGTINIFMNIWLMQLFMLLAGSSAFLALKKRTSLQFIKERVTRIFFPLVFGILIIVPPQVYVERVSQGQFSGSLLEFYPLFFDGVYPVGNFSWHHLWFLAYLFVYSLVALPLFRNYNDRGAQLRSHLARLSEKPLGLIYLALPLAAFHVALFWKYPPTNALIGDWGWHSQLFLYFVYGFILVSDHRIDHSLQVQWRNYLVLAIGLTGAYFYAREFGISKNDPNYWQFYALRGTVYRLCGWSWVLAFLGMGKQYLNSGYRGLDAAAAAAYPFYIVHQTVIVVAAAMVVCEPWNIATKLTCLVTTAFTVALLSVALTRRLLSAMIPPC